LLPKEGTFYNVGMISQELLISFCRFLSEFLGPSSEVVLHDARTGTILWINENPLSHRTVGEVNSTTILSLLDARCRKEQSDHLIGSINRSEGQTVLRTSNLMIREEGKLQYVICINQDVSCFSQIRGFLDNLFAADAPTIETEITEATDIEEMMTNIILEEVKHGDVYRLEGKEAKLAILSRLEKRGVFKVKQAIPKVCEILGIAPPTVYKYLKELERTRKK